MCERIIGVFGRTAGNILTFCLISCLTEHSRETGGDDGGQQQSSMFRREAGTEQVLPVYLSSQFFQVQTKKYLRIM